MYDTHLLLSHSTTDFLQVTYNPLWHIFIKISIPDNMPTLACFDQSLCYWKHSQQVSDNINNI